MTDDERALLAAVAAAPADDVPRLVYADWLDEHGRPERAEFIRLQIAWHRALTDPVWFHTRNHYYNRLQDHSWKHGLAKCEDRPPLFNGVVWEAHCRGFVGTVIVSAQSLDVPLTEVLTSTTAPLDHLDFRYLNSAGLTKLTDAIPRLAVRQVAVNQVYDWPPGSVIDLAGDTLRLAIADWPPAVEVLRLGPVFPPGSVAPFLPIPTSRYLPRLDLRAVRGLSDADRLRLRTRFGDRVLLP